jgi:dolichol-phosphate mannosyltransferase
LPAWAASGTSGLGSLCVCVPTYNEAQNVESFVSALLAVFDHAAIDGTVLVIDDGSPDGTGQLADGLSAQDGRVQVLHRRSKSGIGRAYEAGFMWALERDFDLVAEMDCDFSHDPASLPEILGATRTADLVIGSRYVPGGDICGWALTRRIVSRAGCWYARTLLGVPVRDLTGGFKCFRRTVLERISLEESEACGYGFQIELTWRALQAGVRVVEVPIVFRDRAKGDSKMSASIALEAAVLVLRLARSRLLRSGPLRHQAHERSRPSEQPQRSR